MGLCVSLQAKEPSSPPDGNIETTPEALPESLFPPGLPAAGPLPESPALRKGRAIYRAGLGGFEPMPTSAEIRSMGGKDGIVRLFGFHYRRLFQDPRMSVLFDVSQQDSNVSAAAHGERLALALLGRWLALAIRRSSWSRFHRRST